MRANGYGIVSLEDGLKLLRPILPELESLPSEAFRIYNENFRRFVPVNTSRGMGSDLHEILIQLVRERMGARAGIEIKDSPPNPRFLLIYRNRALVQFKTLRKEKVPVNSPTETTKKFDGQFALDGTPPCPRFVVGPWVSEDGVELLGSLLVCTRGYKRPYWNYDLLTGESVEALEFPNLGMPDDDARADEASDGEISDII